MIDLFFYYVFYCSAVLFYGIGMDRELVLGASLDKSVFQSVVKCFISTLCSTALSWQLSVGLLVPAHLVELYPLFALLTFIVVTVFIEVLTRITTGARTAEFALSYLIVLLSLNEGATFINTLIIAASCILSFVVLVPVVYALRLRIDMAHSENSRADRKALVVLAMAVIIICMSVWNVSWLGGGFR